MMWRKRQTRDKLATNVHHNEQKPSDLVNILPNLSIKSEDLSIKREKAMREVQRLGQEIEQEPVEVDQATMELAESVGLIGPTSRTHDLHQAIQRFHDLISVNATVKAAQMAADVIRESTPPQLTWVGLTPSEIDQIIEDAIDPMDALLQTMDKLKDKNI